MRLEYLFGKLTSEKTEKPVEMFYREKYQALVSDFKAFFVLAQVASGVVFFTATIDTTFF